LNGNPISIWHWTLVDSGPNCDILQSTV
jgi:hypothetical protein